MSSTPASTPRKPGARDRLVAAAERLFQGEGIRAVGVDRLCAEAGVSKRSLYQHFSGKDAVVTAMLEATAAEQSARIGLAATGRSPRDQVLGVFEWLEAGAEASDFRGCPFVAAAVELKDPEHPATAVAREQKAALTAYFAHLARDGGADEPDLLALQLTLVFDGASAYGVVRGGRTEATRRAVETLMTAHGMSPSETTSA